VTPKTRWRRRDALAIYEAHAGPNMTPMVDVVMVILIFFMATTVIIGPEFLLGAGIEAGADTARPDPRFAIEAPVFTLTLSMDGQAVVVDGLGLRGGPPSSLPGAAASLASELDPGSVEIVITPGDDVPYAAAVRAQDDLIAAGFTSVGLR
jgi:biopolymer transport protein ExbD